MSIARGSFLKDVNALEKAVSLSTIVAAQEQERGRHSGILENPGLDVLRRGAAITGLVMLEDFIRNRTEELLDAMQRWPARYEDLPRRFRHRATIEALPLIARFAQMLRGRDDENYEAEIIAQVRRMVSVSPPRFQFTKFIAGDYTGNISDTETQKLLKAFQVKDCWRSMQKLSADVGFGVPSVEEVLKTIVDNRHRSAHAARYTPTASDVMELPYSLRLVGICIDAALSASVTVALNEWRAWVGEDFDWRQKLDIYLVVPRGAKCYLIKKGAKKATKILDDASDAKAFLPRKVASATRLVVIQGADRRPKAWDIA